MTIDDLQERCNLRRGQIENALKFLAAEEVAPIRRVSIIHGFIANLHSGSTKTISWIFNFDHHHNPQIKDD